VSLLFALIASVVVSMISLVGVITLYLNDKVLKKILLMLVGFGAGGLIGGAFFHIIPESLEKQGNVLAVFIYVVLGFIAFFILEKYLFWRHCHDAKCKIHTFTYLNLIGDGIHNFIDGMIIGASYFLDTGMGLVTTVAIILHEIPQELGDFGVLVYGGFSKKKALYFNFLSALTAIAGTFIGYFFSVGIKDFSKILLPLAAGGFIYIAACDLIPQLHKQKDRKQSMFSMAFFILGTALMLIFNLVFGKG